MYSDSRSKAGKLDILPLSRARAAAAKASEAMPPAVSEAVDLVSQAAAAMDELVAYGQNISEVSERGIVHYRQLAATARDKADGLQRQLSTLRREYDDLLNDSRDRIAGLEQTVEEQAREIEKLRSLLWPDLRT